MWVLFVLALVLASGCMGRGAEAPASTTSTTISGGYVVIAPAGGPSTTVASGVQPTTTASPQTTSTTLRSPAKTFKDWGGGICVADGKPIVRMYSKSTCEHCLWGKPLFKSAVHGFGGAVDARLWEFGPDDDLLTEEKESAIPDGEWAHFISGNPSKSVPFYNVGCRFTRVGNGHYIRNEPDLEVQELEALISYAIEAAQGTSS